MGWHCDISALLSLAMNTDSKQRKAAALSLVEAMRTDSGFPDGIDQIATRAEQKYGRGVAAEIHGIVVELGLR